MLVLLFLLSPGGAEKVTNPELRRRNQTAPSVLNGARRASSKAAFSPLGSEEDLFTAASLPELHIEISRAGMAMLRRYHWQWNGNGAGRVDVSATVREADNKVYTNVAVHLKGSAGSFRSIDDRPALTLNFDKLAAGQRFHGLKKIHLNNSVQDPSYFCEQLSRELFNAAGVPAPRATQAKVELNGRDLGVYVLVEGWNKQFLKRHFKNPDGTLYDGGFAKDITYPLEIDSGEKTDRSDLEELAAAARESNSGQRLAQLGKVLDVDEFISFLATEVLLAHWDGYAMNKNNYRIYHDPGSDRLIFLPHGMDQMFGVSQARPTDSITPPMKGLVARAVMQTSEGRARYFERIGMLVTNVYRTEAILMHLDELNARLKPLLTEEGADALRKHERAVASLRQRIVQRGRSIHEQLTMRPAPLEFDTSGVAPLNGWKPKIELGNAKYAEAKSEEGRKLLRITAGGGYGSWRTKVLLDPGHYQFAGRIKVEGLSLSPDDSRNGVGLRVSGGQFEQHLLQDSDWTEVSYEFAVQGPADVELVCECRAQRGQVLFDVDSLRLTRK